MNVLRKNQSIVGSLTILLVIILGSVPTNLTSLSQEEPLHEGETGVNSLKGAKIKVPRLSKKEMSRSSNFDQDTISETNNNSNLNANLAIGSQSGKGGGSFTISDSFNWTGTEIINTSN
ncbi:MAG: hypothetical protein ACFFFH_06210, partial [Candidatus Thorarchaeota archaeon]